MDSATIWECFHAQREEFCRLFELEMKEAAKTLNWPGTASAESALAFAEALILCPTLEAIQSRMRLDLTGARSLLIAADQIKRVSERDSKNAPFSDKRLKENTPFYLLAFVVLEAVQKHIAEDPDSQG
jgi:hypothetical protein